ncbi:hypothetical protein KM043_004295 [Ampulex compressa]|nr:hypothetical protein KM043_004295 [Ampulex compressa]
MAFYHLVSWGANSHGQLGQGIRSEECVLPNKVDLSVCSLNPKNIKKIIGGAGHTLILDKAGRVYACGWNNRGQTGLSKAEDSLIFQKICGLLENKIVENVVCGWDSTAVLTAEGELFAWGSNNYGQLGKSTSDLRSTHVPFNVVPGERIKCASMGLRHTALVNQNGRILVSGAGNKGQLGLSHSKNNDPKRELCAFTEVPDLENIREVACGQHHTIAITEEGDLFVFGDNKHGQLGSSPEKYPRIWSPLKLTNIEFGPTTRMYSGWTHTVALNDSEIFSWGRNTYGQLGCQDLDNTMCWKPKRPDGITHIRQISVGSEHNVALAEDGTVWCWGWNEHGNCGNGNTQDVHVPQKLSLPPNSKAILVGTGAGHSFAVIKQDEECYKPCY